AVFRKLLPLGVMLVNLCAIDAQAGEAFVSSPDNVVIRHCELEYRRSSVIGVAHMGTTTTTILQDCYVRLGDRVKAGQGLGRVMDGDIRAELEIRKAQALDDIEIRLNQAKYEQAVNKMKRSRTLQKKDFVSNEELASQELEATTSKLQIEESKFKH